MDTINGFLGGTATDAINTLNEGSSLVLNDIVPVVNNTVLPVRGWVLGVLGTELLPTCGCSMSTRATEAVWLQPGRLLHANLAPTVHRPHSVVALKLRPCDAGD